MKRSEMINLIASHLQHFAENGFGNYKDDADYILFDLEHKGMKPPIIKDKSWQILENGEMTYAVHEWESEEAS